MRRLQLTDRLVDLDSGVVEGHGTLRHTELALLTWLAEHPGETFSLDELHRVVWGYAATVTSRAAYTCVGRVRALVEPDPRRPVHLLAERGRGYRLAGGRLVGEAPRAGNVGPAADGFVGRTREIAALVAPGARVLTVVGPGGVGKSRLVAEAARRSLVPGGAWTVGLAHARDRGDVLAAVAAVVPGAGPLGGRLAALGACWLVLDGADAALEAVGALVGAWAAEAGEARILVTSRQRLGVAEEVPLAVEVIAANVALVGPGEVLRALDAGVALKVRVGPARGETLDAVVQPSWDALGDELRDVLAALASVDGDLRTDVVEVALAPAEVDVTAALGDLVDRSLLGAAHTRAGGTRWRLLAPIRAFVRRQRPDEDHVLGRLAEHLADAFARACAADVVPCVRVPVGDALGLPRAAKLQLAAWLERTAHPQRRRARRPGPRLARGRRRRRARPAGGRRAGRPAARAAGRAPVALRGVGRWALGDVDGAADAWRAALDAALDARLPGLAAHVTFVLGGNLAAAGAATRPAGLHAALRQLAAELHGELATAAGAGAQVLEARLAAAAGDVDAADVAFAEAARAYRSVGAPRRRRCARSAARCCCSARSGPATRSSAPTRRWRPCASRRRRRSPTAGAATPGSRAPAHCRRSGATTRPSRRWSLRPHWRSRSAASATCAGSRRWRSATWAAPTRPWRGSTRPRAAEPSPPGAGPMRASCAPSWPTACAPPSTSAGPCRPRPPRRPAGARCTRRGCASRSATSPGRPGRSAGGGSPGAAAAGRDPGAPRRARRRARAAERPGPRRTGAGAPPPQPVRPGRRARRRGLAERPRPRRRRAPRRAGRRLDRPRPRVDPLRPHGRATPAGADRRDPAAVRPRRRAPGGRGPASGLGPRPRGVALAAADVRDTPGRRRYLSPRRER
ncbi:MAG: winged helix-turn-helix domain-containing protein [Myxococcota bacterium]